MKSLDLTKHSIRDDELGDALVFGAAHLHGAGLRVKRTSVATSSLFNEGHGAGSMRRRCRRRSCQ
jgi:hypothetical protein